MHVFYALEARKGRREFAETVIRAASRESAIVSHPEIVWLIDVTRFARRSRSSKNVIVLDVVVLGQEVTMGLHGNKAEILRDFPRNVVEGSVVVSHPRVRRHLGCKRLRRSRGSASRHPGR